MSHIEHVCQLCGVSFAIPRIRRPDEPEEAAWFHGGHDYVDEEGGDKIPVCCRDESTGCKLLERERLSRDGFIGLEHLSGPGCTSDRGYSGQRIALQEMKGCRAVQCLVKKSLDFVPEPDDEDFELESNFFLSGIGEGSPYIELIRDIKPVRHGVDRVNVRNCIPDDGNEWALPFHPACFEVFKQVSQLRLGNVDVEGLWYWRILEGSCKAFFEQFPRAFEVRNARYQFVQHEPGTEYLVANPVDVPGLSSLLKPREYVFGNKILFGWKYTDPNGQYRSCQAAPPRQSLIASDPFSALSAELTTMIVECLPSKDITNLRLAAPTFRQLPSRLFRRLLLEDMPWLWEARDLPAAEMDWYHLYRMFKFCWGNFKGLQNRKRIWKDVEEVVRRIGKYRKEGKIGN